MLGNQGAKNTRGSGSQCLLGIGFHITAHFHNYTFSTLVAQSWSKEVEENQIRNNVNKLETLKPTWSGGLHLRVLNSTGKCHCKATLSFAKGHSAPWQIPDHWKRANIVTLSEKGKKVPWYYRPTSRISVYGKVTQQTLLGNFKESRWLGTTSKDFPRISCVSSTWVSHTMRGQWKSTGCYLDLSKACDMISSYMQGQMREPGRHAAAWGWVAEVNPQRAHKLPLKLKNAVKFKFTLSQQRRMRNAANCKDI